MLDKMGNHYFNSSSQLPFFRTLVATVKNIFEWRLFIWRIFKRDFTASYKKSFLGLAWLVVGPLLAMSSWIFLNLTGVLMPGTTGVPYPVYLLISLGFWNFFMGVYTGSANVFNASSGLLLQVRFPIEAMLAKQILQEVATFSIALGINLVVISFFGVFAKWTIFLLPLVCMPLIFLSCGFGLLAALSSIVFPEAKKVLDLGLGLLFFVTPILYTRSVLPDWIAGYAQMNPLVALLGTARDMILFGTSSNMQSFFLQSVVSLIFFLISLDIFLKSERWLIEKI